MNLVLKRKILIFLLAGVLLGIAGGKWYSLSKGTPVVNAAVSQDRTDPVPDSTFDSAPHVDNIPSKVYDVLKYVETFHEPKPGYRGGRVFHNYEELLPKRRPNGNLIHYREWDVNPDPGILKRGPERLVTGDNKTAWYTNDHYKSFIKIR